MYIGETLFYNEIKYRQLFLIKHNETMHGIPTINVLFF